MAQVTSSGSAKVTLPADEEILITREFDAPRHLVYKAYTTPELVSRWWPGQRGEMRSAEIDLRVGGQWRYVMLAHGEHEVAFHGEYQRGRRERAARDHRGLRGRARGQRAPALNIVTFEESGGRTTLTILMRVESREVRDMIIGTGMEGGMQEGMDLLEQIARELA